MYKTKLTIAVLLLSGIILQSCVTTAPAVVSGGGGGAVAAAPASSAASGQPDWVRDPYAKYDAKSYVAARGSGDSPQAAERDALRQLVSIFGQEFQVDEKTSTAFKQAVENDVIANWSEVTTNDTTIVTSTGMDSLVGAEIGDTWYDGKSLYWASAVLNKTKALQTYSNLVDSNKAMIDNLINMPVGEKNSFDGFARYQLAATIADITKTYGHLLTFIGAPALAQGLKSGDDYRLEAISITKAIPVGVTVQNDKAGRIQGAFAKSLSGLGFRSGGAGSRYTIAANVVISPVELANNPNKFVRIEVSADLTDTSTGTVLLPFNFNSREGHTNVSEAENRAIAAAEKKINDEYPKLLNAYLAQLMPKK